MNGFDTALKQARPRRPGRLLLPYLAQLRQARAAGHSLATLQRAVQAMGISISARGLGEFLRRHEKATASLPLPPASANADGAVPLPSSEATPLWPPPGFEDLFDGA